MSTQSNGRGGRFEIVWTEAAKAPIPRIQEVMNEILADLFPAPGNVVIESSTPALPDEMFACAHCHGEFVKDWSDAEADSDYRENFPEHAAAGSDTVIVCDNCYRKVMGSR